MSNTQEEINRKRNEYMETLNLQIQLNDANLQANKLYLRTGQLPPTSQIPDTRTTSEKLANIEYLKSEIAKSMSKIGSPTFSYAVADGMLNSPLNVDNKMVEFFAQNSDSIMKELEKNYKFGIKGDKNDVETLVIFVKDMMVNKNNMVQSVKSYMNSTSDVNRTSSLILSDNDVELIQRQIEEIVKKLMLLSHKNRHFGGMQANLLIVKGYIEDIKRILPDNNTLASLIKDINDEELFNEYTEEQKDTMVHFFDLLKNLPKYSDINYLLNQLNMSLENRNANLSENIMIKILSLFEKYSIDDLIRYGRQYHELFRVIIPGMDARENNIMRQQQIREQQANQQLQHVIIDNPEDNAAWVRIANQPEEHENTPVSVSASSDYIPYNLLTNPFDLHSEPRGEQIRENPHMRRDLERRRRGRPSGRGIIKPKEKAIKTPSYKPFGINEINHKKLDNGILTVRRKSKTNYMDLPSKAISSNLKGIIKTISGGGTPGYNEMSKLTEDEQDYLHKLVKKSDLQDKLSVPTPSKDKQEKDFHEFEVLRGELMSGNDSKDLVKKFKLLIVRLSKQGVLPKNQVNELLEELVMLGY